MIIYDVLNPNTAINLNNIISIQKVNNKDNIDKCSIMFCAETSNFIWVYESHFSRDAVWNSIRDIPKDYEYISYVIDIMYLLKKGEKK